MQVLYDRLGIHVWASWRDVVRAANGRIARRHRRDPTMKDERKRFYKDMLERHTRHQHLVRTFRL